MSECDVLSAGRVLICDRDPKWNRAKKALLTDVDVRVVGTMAGELGKGKASYEELLQMWKEADARIPVVNRARAEYARLDRERPCPHC